jgi:tRNA U34 5-methylaminomethyl-2-thiouridine-forming methyltransferase MnmC
MLSREIIRTADGSQSIYVPSLGEHYHSIHGAVQESEHVFMKYGFDLHGSSSLSILEVGFGTGLNALLTLARAEAREVAIRYHSLELYPLTDTEYEALSFARDLMPGLDPLFKYMHQSEWEKDIRIGEYFTIKKMNIDLVYWEPECTYDLVYFDAFAPEKQPELWTESIFKKIGGCMNKGAILSTYCCKGDVKRAMQAAGLTVSKKPGPPGKREITVAVKP